MAGGARSYLENPQVLEQVAELYAAGATMQEIGDVIGVTRQTAASYTRDPRVQRTVTRFTEERVNRILRRIDNELEERVDDVENMDTELILKMRKELLGNALKATQQRFNPEEQPASVNDMASALEENPELAKELQEMLKTTKR